MQIANSSNLRALPVLPLYDTVLFPNVVLPVFVNRQKSIDAINSLNDLTGEKEILVTGQKITTSEYPSKNEIYHVGTLARVVQTVSLPNNNIKIVLQGIERVRIHDIEDNDIIKANYTTWSDDKELSLDELSVTHLGYDVLDKFYEYTKNNKKINQEIVDTIQNNEGNTSYIANIISSVVNIPIAIKQSLLEAEDVGVRLERLHAILTDEYLQLDTEQRVQQRVKKQIEKNQREYYLNEQMKAIQKELENNESSTEFSEIERKIKRLKLSKEAKEKAQSEFKKLKMMNPMSAESAVVRNYLDTLLAMPWGAKTHANIDIPKAEGTLERDHYGLAKVKERIVEYLSVLKRSNKIKGPILCLIGPPGVGKTSLVKSIAESMGRKYAKFSLGGVRDEAEIRGHRRTYLGSMPGKIINLIKKTGVDNPVMLLDEIDKMSSDFRGDPASALLEVLDPEQNSNFGDHYMEVDYNLSDVVFVATANSYDLPIPLLDRLEIIDISGYIEKEKLEIAKKYLLPKQLKAHNMKESELIIPEDVLLHIIRYYTKESGVRGLERKIGTLARKALTKILKEEGIKSVELTLENVRDYLGVPKYRFGMVDTENQIGITTGLAYTSVGGDLLCIEATSFPGEGKIKCTGKLGEVMKESAEAAYSCFLSRAGNFGITNQFIKERDIHLHVPEGATPKDGPSAGITIYTTIVSLMTKRAVRKDVAMTGEITLRGKVLPIGGLKEKLLAASRGGIKTVIIPTDNEKDLEEIPQEIMQMLEIRPVHNIEEVLEIALVK